MYRVRLWSVRNAFWLNKLYALLEAFLVVLNPLLERIGHQRLDRGFAAVEHCVKGFLFDSQGCGQCTLKSTGMACPMNCPKTLRNGPCGGVRADGNCEIKTDMTCIWVTAWEGSHQLRDGEQEMQVIQDPVDARLQGSSAWLRAVRKRIQQHKAASDAF
ncbi:MAG: hypothetical protein HOC23_16855 [Halieaceae bacterium]|jgi:hypothetical protein|nr:hypothetical protein [Halieaceae bacterium]